MNGSPQSWFDLATSPTMDPRSLISTIQFQDQALAYVVGSFTRSTNWLQATTWVASPLKVTAFSTQPSFLASSNNQDFGSVEAANVWNATHAMTSLSTQLPLVSEGLMYLKAGPFINNLFFDFAGGVTSTDVQISFRANSLTNGDFSNGGTGTIPVFAFPSVTFGGTTKNMQITLLQTGHFQMGIRIVDNSGNYSMLPLDWIVL